VIGYDMDYTLIDYKMVLMEERVYHYSKEFLRSKGFPVSGLQFAPDLVVRGLAIDRITGNILKVDRFGYVRRAMHGTRQLDASEIAAEYGSAPPVDLRNSRWVFLNTLFSVSEGCLFAQLVERLDSGELLAKSQEPFDAARCSTYEQLYSAVRSALFKAHVEGTMKAEVMKDPLRFVNVDPAYTRTLLDQRAAGKKLVLITNSDWLYTNTMMHAAYDPFLPNGVGWRDLFSIVVVSACKPEFFSVAARRPVYEIATADGMLREGYKFEEGRSYAGGYARLVEKCLACKGAAVLYVGDHLFTDVNMAKREFSWRTCMILQELEHEMGGMREGAARAGELTRLLEKKDLQAVYLNYLRTRLHDSDMALEGSARRQTRCYDTMLGAFGEAAAERLPLRQSPEDATRDGAEMASEMAEVAAEVAAEVEVGGSGGAWQRERVVRVIGDLEAKLEECDRQISALAFTEGNHVNPYWGYMSRAGFADKSHLMRQIEKYADIYTSRVSNMLPYTPYKQFLCPQQSLAHSTRSPEASFPMKHWQVRKAEEDRADEASRRRASGG